MVLIQTDYTAHRFGTVSKFVRCERCGADFAYMMVRAATGRGTSLYFLDEAGAAERAERRADSNLQQALANEVEPVECPGCGRFQTAMVREARRRYLGWMRPWPAFFALCILTPLFFCGTTYVNFIFTAAPIVPALWIVYATAVLVVAIVLMPFARYFLALGHDPNDLTPAERKAYGYGHGIPKEDYERILAQIEAKRTQTPSLGDGPAPPPENVRAVTDVVYNGASLGKLFGKGLQSKEVQDFYVSILEMPEETRFDPHILYWTWKGHGLAFEFHHGKLVFVFLYAEGAEGCRQFPGELPLSLGFTDTRADVERKLGTPSELSTMDGFFPVFATYKARGIKINYVSKDLQDLGNRIEYVGIFPVPTSVVAITTKP